ncbi:MAG: CPBP family intramembrane glutamic endopeptidase [Gemmataceae bacterium]
MPAQLWSDAARMAACGLMVAAFAIPLGLAARLLAQKRNQPILLRPKAWPVPWGGFELLLLFAFALIGPASVVGPALTASGFYPAVYGANAPEDAWLPMKSLWSAVIFTPLFLGFVWLMTRAAYPTWRPEAASLPAKAAAAVGTWLGLHPMVAAVHFTVAACFLAWSWQPDSHPLEQKFRDGRPMLDQVLFAVEAGIAAPLLEEVLFRGALLPWLMGKRYRPVLTLIVVAALGLALSIETTDGNSEVRYGPVCFTVFLFAGSLLHRVLRRKHQRTESAIIVSAAFFALVHNPVWPSPIPLFVLGLGLGWLAVRTRGWLAPAIVHGLFNLVSVLFVLRG